MRRNRVGIARQTVDQFFFFFELKDVRVFIIIMKIIIMMMMIKKKKKTYCKCYTSTPHVDTPLHRCHLRPRPWTEECQHPRVFWFRVCPHTVSGLLVSQSNCPSCAEKLMPQ